MKSTAATWSDRAILLALACALAALLPGPAGAQLNAMQPSMSNQVAPLPGTPGLQMPGASLLPPGGGVPTPQVPLALPPGLAPQVNTQVPAGHVALLVAARYGRDYPQAIGSGIVWRVYADRPDNTGLHRLIKEERSATPTFLLPPGSYIVHATFGLASAVKSVTLRGETVREVFEIPAGGLRLEGRVGDARIPASQISFDIYRGSQFEPGDRRPIIQGVQTGDVVLLPEGVYYIVSNYGDSNAVVRSDIRVQTAKLTDVTVTHRAAIITLKLATQRGGEAIANTAWSVLTPGGDVVKESIGAFPRVVLAEGDYRVIARNENRSYEREFKVITGVDSEIEVVAQ